jgi:hypothetical protein
MWKAPALHRGSRGATGRDYPGHSVAFKSIHGFRVPGTPGGRPAYGPPSRVEHLPRYGVPKKPKIELTRLVFWAAVPYSSNGHGTNTAL